MGYEVDCATAGFVLGAKTISMLPQNMTQFGACMQSGTETRRCDWLGLKDWGAVVAWRGVVEMKSRCRDHG